MKHVLLVTLFFSFSISLCQAQYGLNLDTLLASSKEYPAGSGALRLNIFYLAGALKNYRVFSDYSIKGIKMDQVKGAKSPSNKTIAKMELRYKKSQEEVDSFLNHFSLYLKRDIGNRNDFNKCDDEFREALLSIRKLYKILKRKENNDRRKRAIKFYYPKKSTIVKIIKNILTWENYLKSSGLEENKIYISLLKRGYWRMELYKEEQ